MNTKYSRSFGNCNQRFPMATPNDDAKKPTEAPIDRISMIFVVVSVCCLIAALGFVVFEELTR